MWYLSNMAGRAGAGLFATLVLVTQAHGDNFFPQPDRPFAVHGDRHYLISKPSTLGSGIEFRYDLTDSIKLRFGHHDYESTSRDIRNEVDSLLGIKLRTTSVLLDWHPFDGTFRTTAGLTVNHHRLTGSARHTAVLNVGPGTGFGYLNEQQSIFARDLLGVDGEVRFRRYTPYAGIGWGNRELSATGLHHSIDIGAIMQNRPRVDLNVSGPVADMTRRFFPGRLEALIAEEERGIQDGLSKARMFPVISIALSYQF